MNAIEVDHLSKTINGVPLLRDLHLRVAAGEAYGLIGPAGFGKSTLVHVLLGFLHADAGTARVFGHTAPDAARALIGFVPERAAYHLRFQAREYLLYLGGMGRLSGRTLRRRVDEVLQQVGLATAAERSLSNFSRGMLQRLGIAQALLNRPPLLVLDDPLTMLLEQEQHELIDLLVSLRQQGQTMLVCTQYAQGLVYLCDRIGVLADGHIVAEATAHDLRAYANNVRLFLDQLTPTLRQQLRLLSPAVTTSDNSVTLRPNNHRLQAQVLRILLDNGVTVLSLRPLENPLERFYVDAMRNTAMVRSGAIQSPPVPPAVSPAAPPPSYAPPAPQAAPPPSYAPQAVSPAVPPAPPAAPPSYAPQAAPPAPTASPDGLLSQLLAQRGELPPASQSPSPAPPSGVQLDSRVYTYPEQSEPYHESAYQHPPAEPAPESDPTATGRPKA